MSEKEEDELLLQDASNLVDDDVCIELQCDCFLGFPLFSSALS